METIVVYRIDDHAVIATYAPSFNYGAALAETCIRHGDMKCMDYDVAYSRHGQPGRLATYILPDVIVVDSMSYVWNGVAYERAA